MAPITFAVNVQRATVEPGFVRRLRPTAWLVPPTRVSRPAAATLAGIRGRARVIVDNGGFDTAAELVQQFEPRARALRAALSDLDAAEKRRLLRGDIPAGLLADVDALASDLGRAARLAAPKSPLAERLGYGPDALIGAESSFASAWTQLGFSAEVLARRRERIRDANERVLRQAAKEAPGVQAEYMPVVSCLDHDTAFDAGGQLRAAGFRRVAIGFGAYMGDDSRTSVQRVDGTLVELSSPLPSRYLRSAAVLRGLFSGYAAGGRARPEAVHLLGLGTPIMLALAALSGRGVETISADATSPFQDATVGLVYAPTTWVKVRSARYAWRLATGNLREWPCRCPFCSDYHANYPLDAAALRRAWGGNTDQVERHDLSPGGALFAHAGILGEPTRQDQRRAMNVARIGHNHWVLQRYCRLLSDHARSKHLDTYVGNLCRRYAKAATDEYAKAITIIERFAASGVLSG